MQRNVVKLHQLVDGHKTANWAQETKNATGNAKCGVIKKKQVQLKDLNHGLCTWDVTTKYTLIQGMERDTADAGCAEATKVIARRLESDAASTP